MLPRTKIVEKFNTIIDDEKECINIETNIYDNIKHKLPKLEDNDKEFIMTYREKARSIFDNLNPNSYFDNKEGITKYKNNVKQIATIDVKELRYKNLWKTIKQNQEILDKNLMELKPTAETDQFLCTKCHKRKTTFYTMQIRSSDEPETAFITCLICNNSWREG